jgi:hypothetical protein
MKRFRSLNHQAMIFTKATPAWCSIQFASTHCASGIVLNANLLQGDLLGFSVQYR